MRSSFWVISLVLVCTASGLLAQGDRGIITGTVKDSSGAVVPSAQVTAVHLATNTNFKTSTSESGYFTVPNLPVGNYQVRVEHAGFKTDVTIDVVIGPGVTVNVDSVVQVGAATQTVEVTSSGQILQVDTARVATEVSNTLVNDLPLLVNGAMRSPFDLASTTAEVAGGGDANFRVGGGREGAFGMTLDGTAITVGQATNNVSWTAINTPSVEALTEFSVESGGFKAETGHASGGTVSFVSKSGTNEFHGDLYEFLRNQDLDARGFFGATKPVYKQNDFGGTAGGPVWIPKLYNGRNRSFFFFSYEGFRNRVGATPIPYSVPPQSFYTGDLSNFVNNKGVRIPVYDPDTTTLVNGTYVRTAFPNNQIPQSRFDPIAKPIIAYVQPLLSPNVPNLVPGTSAYVRNNYISYGTTLAPNNKYSIKADQVLNSKQKLAFMYSRTREVDTYGAGGAPGLPEPLSGNPGYNRSDVYRVSYDFTISPTLLNRFYMGYNIWEQNHGSYSTVTGTPLSMGLPTLPASQGWQSKGICIPNYPACNDGFPVVTFANSEFTAWGVGLPNGSDNNVYEFKDDMTKVFGPHTLKWGFYWNYTDYRGFGDSNIMGNVTFQQQNTSIPLDTSLATGSAFASFLLGQVSAYALTTPRDVNAQWRSPQGYFQDDWRVTPRLTVNLGLRYEIQLAPVAEGNEMSDFNPTLRNPAAGGIPGAVVFAGFGPGMQNTTSLAPNWYGGIGPRIGLAYALDSKTSMRIAATRSFGPVICEYATGHYSGFVQNIKANDTSTGLSPVFVLKNGAPAWASLPNLDPAVANGTNVSYYNGRSATKGSGEMTYVFDIQRQLGTNMAADIGYLGVLASDIQSALLAYNQIQYQNLPANLNPFTAAGRTLLNSQVGSAAANAAGITAPFPGFNALWGGAATVGQALRPFPQFSVIDTVGGNGDRIGHSTYHAMNVKFTRRYSAGLTLQASYVFSKLLTDSDNFSTANPLSETTYNFRLEKSIGAYDQTHQVKLTYVYDLPFGAGKRYLGKRGAASALFGGWRVAGNQQYLSGTPAALTTSISFPIFNGMNRPTVTTYDGWRAPFTGRFDPRADNFFQPVSFFGPQSQTQLGNATRYNPKLRNWPPFSESISLSRSITIKEQKRVDFRWEAFNVLNRTQFGPLSGGTQLQSANFGLWQTQANTPRQMQASLKFYW